MPQYENPTPVVVALIRCEDGLIAVERAIEPFIGEFSFPGGYINKGESAEKAATRETYEETGILLLDWSPVQTVCTPDNKLLIFMFSEEGVRGEALDLFTPNEEATSLKIVMPGDALCFPLHQQMLEATELWK